MSGYLTHFGNDPARLLAKLRGGMDHLFEDFFVGPTFSNGFFTERKFPALNVWEDEKNLYVESELPGVKLADIEVSIVGDELTVKGEWKAEDTEKKALHRHERPTGSFSRVVKLPVAVDGDNVSAELKDGLLAVTLPKSAAALPHKIDVKSIT